MVTSRRDLTAEAVAAARSVRIELIQLLGEFRDQLVMVGGWVPVLLLGDAPEAHVGTLDIDLAVDFQRLPEASYTTLLRALTGRGYRQDARQPFRFFREVRVSGRAPVVVEVDLLAGEYGGTGPGHRTQPAQDTRARKARGCDLVFADPRIVTVEGEPPGGGRLAVTCPVAGIVPWLVMKGMALADRLKEKDAYDVYYCVHACPGGGARLVEEFRPHFGHSLVREGLGKIRAAFLSPDHVGSRWVADFLDVTEPEARAILQRRAYEEIAAWLDVLGAEPWSAR
jgi:hypothetical protein